MSSFIFPVSARSPTQSGHALRWTLALLWLGTARLAWATPEVGPLPMAEQAQAQAPVPPPSSAEGPGKKRRKAVARDPSAAEVLLLDLSINGQRLSYSVRAEQLPGGGPLLLPAATWAEARLAPLAQQVALSDGTPAYALDAVPGATWNLNRQNLSIDINAPASAFVGSTFGPSAAASVPPPRPDPGVMLNYDLSASHSPGSVSSGALLEAVAFGALGNLVSSALVSRDSNASRYSSSRLDTYWRYDLPHRMETLIVGDTVGAGSGWSRPARYGGVRWGRDFSMRPGFVTLPQLSLAGEAALPSTVEVLVNNARRLSQPVQPGPFDLSNVPIVTGAGELDLVVRDLLGRETVVRQSYYASPRLLAPGLSDFSFEAGQLRTGYGLNSTYGATFGAATWRQGLSSGLTGEARLEGQSQRRAAGVAFDGLLGTWGAAHVALARSDGSTQGPHESGNLVQVGIERSTPQGGGTLQYEHADRGFAPFGEATTPLAASQRARERWLASLGGRLWSGVSSNVSYVQQTRWDGDQVQLLGLSLGRTLGTRTSLNVSLSKRLDGERHWSGFMSLNFQLDGGQSAGSQVSRGNDGQLVTSASARGKAPVGPGLAWQVQAASTASQRAQLGLQYNTSQAQWALDTVSSADGQVSTRLGGRGTVGWLGGMAFASRNADQSSVALVRVDGVEGVSVLRSHQVVAVTDARGLAFVPGLLPWQKNQIAIDPLSLPLDVEVATTDHEVTPFARSGVVLDFGARRSLRALLILRQPDGTPVPPGTRVHLLPAGPEFLAGRRGEVWLTGLTQQQQRVQVKWPKGGCTLELAVPASSDGTPGKIGPLACGEEK